MIDYSTKRKHLQSIGGVPEWYTTGGMQLFEERYAWQGETVKDRFTAVAKAMAQHAPTVYPNWWSADPYTTGKTWEQVFFNAMWDGHLSPSTPLLGNGGLRKRGTTVSCAGGFLDNSLASRYDIVTEAAVLTKHSHGTSYSIDEWPHEGAPLARGGRSGGIMPVIRDLVNCMDEVVQGHRRGSLAYSLRPQHGDFEKVLDYLYEKPESNNVGWLFDDEMCQAVEAGKSDAMEKLAKILSVKMPRGKGYITFISKMNRKLSPVFKHWGMTSKASNLCVAPETQILTDRGYFPIADLVGQNVNVWNGQEWSEVVVAQTGMNQKLYTVTTTSGQVLNCTDYHKFYTVVDYSGKTVMKRTFELKEGDKLIKFDLPLIQGGLTLDKAYTNGFFTGDGFVLTKTGESYVDLYGAKQNLKDFIENEGLTWYEQGDRIRTNVTGLKGKHFVPDASYTIDSRLKWLAGFMDADGTVARNGENESLQATSTELEFLREVQLMLQTLGVNSKIQDLKCAGVHSFPANDGTGDVKEYVCKNAYRLLISSSGLYSLSLLGFKTNRLEWQQRVPQRNAEQFITVESVEDNGRYDNTYCFTEKKRGMGMFNGLLTGNCQEVNLPADMEHTFSCVILNMNLETYRSWPTHLPFIAHVMSDCNISEYLATMDEMSPADRQVLRKIYKFTSRFRAIGNGVLGWHTLMQRERVIIGSLESFLLNDEIFKHLDEDTKAANAWLGQVLGSPEGCAPFGLRNATCLMMPPTKSTAELMAGASEGVGLDTAMVFTKQSAAGEFYRINKVLLEIMKERGVFNDTEIQKIAEERTVKNCTWLTEHEKAVFRTAFEVPMDAYLDLCAQRQPYIDQGQSINLYLTDKDSPEYIMKLHLKAIADENILALYYIYSMRDSGEVTRVVECELCT